MKIRQILAKDSIISHLRATTKEQAIAEIAALIAETSADSVSSHVSPTSKDEIVQILMEREKLGSTGIGNGIAIPHGKLRTLNQIITGFGRSLEGIEFDSQDGRPAHLFFVLLAPENAASLHLKALARLSRLLKDQSFRNKLMDAKTSEEIYNEIVTEDEKF